MASKIQSHNFYVAITPYKVEDSSADEFNLLNVRTAYDDRRKYFYVDLHAGWNTGWGGFGCILMGADDPLTGPKYVKVKDSPKNSQKTINEMGANLEQAKDAIAWLFNKRDWQRLYLAVRNIALNGYIDPYRQQMEKLMQPEPKGEPIVKQVDVMGLMNALSTTGRAKLSDFAKPIESENEEPEVPESVSKGGVLKQYAEQKKKTPDAMLLFRHKDFYKLFNEDAKAAAPILGIRCVGFKNDPDTCMSVFPKHALDTYLPKLIRAGKRVAICDVINDELSNNKNQEDNTMRLNLNANKTNESANVAMQPQVNNNAAPAIEDAVAEEIKDVEVQEVQDIVPVATPKPAETPAETKDSTPAVTVPLSDHGTLVVAGMPKPKDKPAMPQRDKNGKFLKKSEAKAEPKPDPEAVGELAGMLTRVNLVVYKTKKGADAPMIVGFSGEDDERWKKLHEAKPKWVSAGYRKNDEGTKQYHLMFGSRYMAVAKALCEAYNTTDKAAWDKAEQACAGCYDGIVSGFKAEREAKKQERAAAREAAEPAAKIYTNEDVAAMLRKVLAGGNVPEDIERLLKAA